MEKVVSKIKKINEHTHKFYCDICETFLGESKEFSDGYYFELGEFEQSVCINDVGWYKVKMNLCEECRKKYIAHWAVI